MDVKNSKFVPFSAQTRMSGIDFVDEAGKTVRSIRKGAVEAVRAYVDKKGVNFPKKYMLWSSLLPTKGGLLF